VKTFSVSVWRVRAGSEEEFVVRWRELAALTARLMGGKKEPSRLLRDHDEPDRFISVAEWDSAIVLQAWRAGPEFRDCLQRMSKVLVDFTPMTLDDVTRPWTSVLCTVQCWTARSIAARRSGVSPTGGCTVMSTDETRHGRASLIAQRQVTATGACSAPAPRAREA
jgi:heme-degrading monooxygenase HmoA